MADPFDSINFAALHFVQREDGTFAMPPGAVVTFNPVGAFVELKIAVDGGTEVRAILHRTAFKVCTGSSTSACSQLVGWLRRRLRR